MGDYVGTKVKAEEWGYSQSTVANWCSKGLIPGAEQDKKGSPWRIPVNAKCPRPIQKK